MATSALRKHYTISDQEAEIIVNAPVTKVTKPSYADDLHLPLIERKKVAKDILNKWKSR
ncbi:hypothetical protein [Shouchella clausii]|uniref:hypothetical protein n=1 Tax=Shouchella clausii TaxID=79880 RepID=UPI0015CD41CF|nr:hypothetical protein [Shouchella clausii]